jgi:hypothetical protein
VDWRNPPHHQPTFVGGLRCANPSTALPRTSENATSIVSFVGEYSAHLLLKIFRAFARLSIFEHGLSHPGETRRTSIRFCDAIPNWMG